MSIRDAIFTRLSGYSGLTALNVKVYSKTVPQRPALPCVFFEINGITRIGGLNNDTGKALARIRVISIDQTLDDADTVARQVRACLQRYTGTDASITIYDVTIEDEGDTYYDDLNQAHIEQEFTVSYEE